MWAEEREAEAVVYRLCHKNIFEQDNVVTPERPPAWLSERIVTSHNSAHCVRLHLTDRFYFTQALCFLSAEAPTLQCLI